MKKTFKVTLSKPKRTEQFQCQSFEQLSTQITNTFSIDGKIKFMKPRIVDNTSFLKEVKQGSEILIAGTIGIGQKKNVQKIQKPKQDQSKEEDRFQAEMKKEQQENKQKQIKKMKELLKLNSHEKSLKNMKQNKIKEKPIDYFNPEINDREDLGVDYIIYPLYLLNYPKQFHKYCIQYICMDKNPDGLIIEDLGTIFKHMVIAEKIICPLQFVSAFICYCSDDIDYPFPTYGIDYFINRLFSSMKMAFEIDLQKKDEEPNTRIDCATRLFGIQTHTIRTDLTQIDDQDPDFGKEMDKKVVKYFLQCDLGKPQNDTIIKGIKQRFKQKTLWRNFYAFDIEYKEKVIHIQRLPKYLFLHVSRWQYPPAHEQWEEVEFNENEKSSHKVKISRVLDLYDMCDGTLKDSLEFGRNQQKNMFYPFQMQEGFANLKKQHEGVGYSDTELRYMFFEQILHEQKIFHQFCFQPIKGAKPTGKYRLAGMVLHKGDYYHRPNEAHKHDCRGQMMTLMYKRGKVWIKYYRETVQYISKDQVFSNKYWGGKGEWTPCYMMYREIKMLNMQIGKMRQTNKK